jgi:resolvase-like protein
MLVSVAAKPVHSRIGGQRILDLVQRSAVAHVVTYKLDRLFRDCADCLTVTAAWDKKAIALHLVDLGGQTLDTSSAMGRFFLTVMAGAAELERNLIRERTSEAIGYVKTRDARPVGTCPTATRWLRMAGPWWYRSKSRLCSKPSAAPVSAVSRSGKWSPSSPAKASPPAKAHRSYSGKCSASWSKHT